MMCMLEIWLTVDCSYLVALSLEQDQGDATDPSLWTDSGTLSE